MSLQSASTAAALCLAFLLLANVEARGKGVLQSLKPPALFKTGHLVLEIPRLEACKVANNAIVYSNVVMGMMGKVDFVINGDFNMTRSGTSLKEMSIVLTKCRDAVTQNTCEYFQTWRLKDNLCGLWNDPKKPWAHTLDSIEPRPVCPMQQGLYHIRNTTLDMQSLSALPIPMDGLVWLARISAMDDQGLHFCTDLEMEPHRVRQ